jgi:hypothetical protein
MLFLNLEILAVKLGKMTTMHGKLEVEESGKLVPMMPETKLYIVGTGNPYPIYDPQFRPGDNLYTDSVVALM